MATRITSMTAANGTNMTAANGTSNNRSFIIVFLKADSNKHADGIQ